MGIWAIYKLKLQIAEGGPFFGDRHNALYSFLLQIGCKMTPEVGTGQFRNCPFLSNPPPPPLIYDSRVSCKCEGFSVFYFSSRGWREKRPVSHRRDSQVLQPWKFSLQAHWWLVIGTGCLKKTEFCQFAFADPDSDWGEILWFFMTNPVEPIKSKVVGLIPVRIMLTNQLFLFNLLFFSAPF